MNIELKCCECIYVWECNLYLLSPMPLHFVNSSQERFINGAQVITKDACVTKNGILHIINRVLMPSNQTIAQVLRNSPPFSNFTRALDYVGLLEFLDSPNTARTLFVVDNEAFEREIPPELFNCLSVYMRRPLNDLLLFHIVKGTEYNTSIALQRWLYTLQLQFIQVHSFRDGSISLGSDVVPIIATNIPARNGVIHVVDRILFPPTFDFGMCQRFVPTEPPGSGEMMPFT